ncbi:poly(3-hydroxybutyrate) depolymerase [Azoarcus sp. CIB]|uniref:extracellular catalytic domain type 1 short-chain-length polyhydroxyalkanoate depolymerase n=1 Tax=Aromatoleum sp. (strain CIB) TaxID=198107 RepID=UPI00067C913A|nr:PHB depolymerase family esterase [Azoarcus sp. CIB]AKU12194.1 poly(3-hydroxybutyrate) depolymerase [Azoarcus sp. CIB]
MNAPMNSAMLEALRLTRAGQLFEATTLIQRALHGGHGNEPASRSTSNETVIDGDVVLMDAEPAPHRAERRPRAAEATDADFIIVDVQPDPAPQSQHAPQGGPVWSRFDAARLREHLQSLQGSLRQPMAKGVPQPLPEGAQFVTASYSNPAGARSYKLYVPSAYRGQPLPLVVMLHGCTQDPDDFAAGTKMNELAEKQQFLVLYPAQNSGANGSKCWNWFKASDQQRDQGEPSIIAGMTRQVSGTHAVDARRIYVAGLSAGGAMAMTMAVRYPELYAAVGIHSGLPHAVARDLPSALAAMQQGRASSPGGAAQAISGAPPVAAIVFHGDRDTTVHPGNGDGVIAQCMPPSAAQRAKAAPDARVTVEHGQVPQGHAYTRTLYHQFDGPSIAEHWLIHGAGHAWSGGSARGSYTDPKGPDAAEHMLRFFLEHPLAETAG